jgi:UDP-glucuronate 4-epimerase
MKILVAGASDFISSTFTLRFLACRDNVIRNDNHNECHDPAIEEAAQLAPYTGHHKYADLRIDIGDRRAMECCFANPKPNQAVNLASQAGAHYSIENPLAYIHIVGFINILEGCRHNDCEHLVYASSSSVYGGNTKMPFSEHDNVDHPVSLYAATKKANELMAHTYSHLYSLPTTGLRFFTVYGPWGRPDMAPILFAKAILEDRPIDVFNHGKMQRDFTYIDDIVEGVLRVADQLPVANPAFEKTSPDPGASWAPYRVFNIGNHQPVELMAYIGALESAIGKTATKKLLPMQDSDVLATYADTAELQRVTDFVPKTNVQEGERHFVEWYRTQLESARMT